MKCPECGALAGHHPLCQQVDGDTAKSDLKRYYLLWLDTENKHLASAAESENKVRRFKEQVTLWQGKYQIVKQENNALRRKCNAMKEKGQP